MIVVNYYNSLGENFFTRHPSLLLKLFSSITETVSGFPLRCLCRLSQQYVQSFGLTSFQYWPDSIRCFPITLQSTMFQNLHIATFDKRLHLVKGGSPCPAH